MSSGKDLFEPEDFDNLIAAVDSLDIPANKESSASPSLKSVSDVPKNTSQGTSSGKAQFKVDGDPFGADDSLSMENSVDEFAEINDLASDLSELNFDDEPDSGEVFTPTQSFDGSGKKQSSISQFNVDDPFDSNTNVTGSELDPMDAIDAIDEMDDDDDVVDVYAAFLDATDENPKPISESRSAKPELKKSGVSEDPFAKVKSQKNEKVESEFTDSIDYFALAGEEESEKFDGVAAANEISALWAEEQTSPESKSNLVEGETNTLSSSEPLQSSMQKTRLAADKLKAHLESISNKADKSKSPAAKPVEAVKPELSSQPDVVDPQKNISEKAKPQDLALDMTDMPLEETSETFDEFAELHNEAVGEQASNVVEFDDVKFDLPNEIDIPVSADPTAELYDEFADLHNELLEEQSPEKQTSNVVEFEDITFEVQDPSPETKANLESKKQAPHPEKREQNAVKESVTKVAREKINLSKKTEIISDTMLAAFVESTLSSKQKIRMISAQNFARKFPRGYLLCATVMALLGFGYILAIPALLVFTMFNGFEMLNSPFTNSTVMLLTAMFSFSLFLFMVGYKLFDLKFVGPGGITLNHENAANLMEKIQQLNNEHSLPKIHEVVLTRRHELNVIKMPRAGLPVWSKNVLAIGYPLLQTLPAEYFDVALIRRLNQFKKRKNVLHNWLSFMRRTWTIYAVSLKERKGIIDLLHYCFFAPYSSLYRRFAVYVSQRDELYADEKALHYCNDRDLVKTAQTLRITRAMLVQYFWPKLNEDLQNQGAAPHYVQPYSKLPETLNTLLRSKNVDAWFIRLGQEDINPGDPEAPFLLRMETLGQRKVSIPDAFETSAAQHYFADQYDKMTELMDTLWAEEVQKELFEKNIHKGSDDQVSLPCHLAIEPA